ncbi:MAG TPA: alpha/beta hydrolase [Thermoanaerobaculia bacterium]|nr:alpha/beta hydrolase [Thermoanaerobaculia bacterium]
MNRISFLGGNGHCAARLDEARRHFSGVELAGAELIDTPYPGFEGRPRAESFEAFLDSVAAHLREAAPGLVYGTGIGGLLALCLRARGELSGIPLVFQGTVLWGLERRWMPRMMRLGLAQIALRRAFAAPAFQRRFARKHFTRPPSPGLLAAFFDGYARCTAAPDFFAWMTPALLRRLEAEIAARPEALADVRVWWGGLDRVVSPRELKWTEAALGPGARWPLRVFPAWGHYPMIDDPAGWAREISDAVAAARAV